MRPTIQDIVTMNVSFAKDQSSDYDDQSGNGLCEWFEGDAYLANTTDAIQEEGYNTESDWEEAKSLFFKLAEEAGLRFAS